MNPYQSDSGNADQESNDRNGETQSPLMQTRQAASQRTEELWIALISPNGERRAELSALLDECTTGDVREISSYPPINQETSHALNQQYDVILIDIDADPQYALTLVESICGAGMTTVMVCSSSLDQRILMQCMRAGARDFLPLPVSKGQMIEALQAAAERRPASQAARERGGKVMIFMGSKGGTGTTMLACNFAVALAEESTQRTLLIDLDLPLGDVALNLGIQAKYSTLNAVQAGNRLDSSFLVPLLVKHPTGLYVLAAPGSFASFHIECEAILRLVSVARKDFDNVVIDLGTHFDLTSKALFDMAQATYLVTQAGIAELRNSNRLLAQFFSGGKSNVEVVVNRYDPKSKGVSEEHINKAINREVSWRIPNDFVAVRKMQIEATPLIESDTAIARQIRQMARSVQGGSASEAPKKKWSLFG